MDVILWGGRTQAVVDESILRQNGHRVIAVFDDSDPLPESPLINVPIRRGSRFPNMIREECGFVVTFAHPNGLGRVKKSLELAALGMKPLSAIHRTAYIDADATLGIGNQVMPKVVIMPRAKIGDFCLINTGTQIDHDCDIGDGCELGPGAVLCGIVTMEPGATVFANATVGPRVKIGLGATVGAGAVALHDIPAGETWVGNPARRLG